MSGRDHVQPEVPSAAVLRCGELLGRPSTTEPPGDEAPLVAGSTESNATAAGSPPGEPNAPSSKKVDRFPDHTEWVRGMLVGGREKDAIRHVMEMYRPALAAYFAGSSFRHRFQSDETPESAVNGFFGDQMGRPGFLSSWLQARSRFRYWLLVSFVNHMRHRLRQERSEERRREKLARNSARTSRDVVRDQFDAQLARGLVRAAMLEAERICRAEGREQDWLTFLAHFIDDRPYGELAAAEGVGTREIANRVRFAQKRLVKCMLETLSLNGSATREELHRELSHLEEAMSRWRS